MVAKDQEWLCRVGQFLRDDGWPLRKRQKLSSGQARQFKLLHFAHVDEPRWFSSGEAGVRPSNRDFRNRHERV